MDIESQHRFRMEKEVDRAIENNEFYPVYQPLVDSTTETLNAFEALLRWKHPERGELAPTEFISIAERHDLMEKIGNFVLEEACRFASTWNVSDNQMMPGIVVNVAPSQLSNPEFTANVLQRLARLGLPPERLELEITEEVLIQNHQQAIRTIKELQTAGIAMSIDDFGSGQTSLSYLSQFPVTTLKIDRAFIRDLGKDACATEINRSMIAMGSRLGYTIVAEGVERSDQSELRKAWNCTLLQGYLFSKPVATEDALSMIYNDGQAEGFYRAAG